VSVLSELNLALPVSDRPPESGGTGAGQGTGTLGTRHASAAVPAPRGRGPGGVSGDGYQYLAPLMSDYAAMAARDPRRARLRVQVITGYLPVARNIALRYAQRGEPLDDLVQVATLALINAVDRFDPERGHPFLGYAVPTITGEVRRHFRDKTWSMRVPRRLKDLHLSINGAVLELSQSLDRVPRPSDIAAKLEVSIDEVLEALEAARSYRARSLDQMLTADTDGDAWTLGDLFGALDPGFETFMNSHCLAPYLAALPARERTILIMRFHCEMTQSQIAARIGISQMHVSRLLTQTLARLRHTIDRDARADADTAGAGAGVGVGAGVAVGAGRRPVEG
jgi:RNA polymerase sigma-B factor